MKVRLDKYRQKLSFAISLILHGGLLAFLLYGVDHHIKMVISDNSSPTDVVQAVMLDEALVNKEVERLETIEKKYKIDTLEQQQTLQHLKQEQEQTQIKLQKMKANLEKTKLEESNQLAELKIQQELERKRLNVLDEQRQEEQDRLQRVKQEREAEQKKLLQAQEARKKMEEKKLKEKRAGIEIKRLEAKRLADIKAAQQRILLQQAVGNAKETLKNVFDSHWIKPPNSDNLMVELEIMIQPDGKVLEVKISKPSGNKVFDESAIKAVWKASPLTMPSDIIILKHLEKVTLGFKNV
ncbi:MAG: tolA [Francisellaceae bacterium]|nr:tolA [Francisellaceae bacterium]